MSNFRIMLLSTAAIGFAGALATPASAGEVEKTASFSGNVNRLVSVIDDGDSTDLKTDENTSRATFQGSSTSESLTTAAKVEISVGGAASDSNSATGATAGAVGLRHSYVSLSNNMGTLVIGQTNPAGEMNGWGTGKMAGASGNGVDGDTPIRGSGATFLVKNTGNSVGQEDGDLTTLAPGITSFSNGRTGVIRYDSPDLNGFAFSASINGGADAAEETDFSAGYSADYDGTAVAVGVMYISSAGNSTTIDSAFAVGAGVELASGINVHAGYGKEKGSNATDPDEKMWTVDLGYDMSVIDAGATSLVINYTDRDDVSAVNDDMKWYGLSVQQELTDYGTSLYGGVSRAEYNVTGTNYEDITAGWVGIKVSF